jgi:hypothetical protein
MPGFPVDMVWIYPESPSDVKVVIRTEDEILLSVVEGIPQEVVSQPAKRQVCSNLLESDDGPANKEAAEEPTRRLARFNLTCVSSDSRD